MVSKRLFFVTEFYFYYILFRKDTEYYFTLKICIDVWVQCFMPVIPAIWEDKAGRSVETKIENSLSNRSFHVKHTPHTYTYTHIY
jgi:hypothetical protein